MKQIRFILALLLALSLCLTSVCALAESDTPEYNLVTITLDSFTMSEPSLYSGTLPLDVKLTIGEDGHSLDTLRALVALDIGFDGEHLITLEFALEENAFKLHLDGISQDISIPMNQALEELLSEIFLGGEPLSEAPPEFMEAFGDLLTEIDTFASAPTLRADEETPEYYIYSEADWRSFFVEYPSKMRAVPAGEEEIVFEGKTYTARKYTYHIDHLSYNEYEEYRSGLLMTNEEYRASEAYTAGLQEAIDRMVGIGLQYSLDRQLERQTADNGGTAIAEMEYDPYEGYFFSEEGTFYLIDEVMGTLESGTRTMHYPDGTEYAENVEFMSYLTDTQLVMETISTAPTGSTRETNSVTLGEDGTTTVVSTVESSETSSYEDFSYSMSSSVKNTEVIGETGSVEDQEETYTITYTADGVTDTQTERTATHTEVEYLSDSQAKMSISTVFSSAYGGATNESLFSADLTIDLGVMPEGTLLRISGKPFNPLNATEAELDAFAKELEQWLMNIVYSIIPPIETPSSVGGALLG